jgi:hypothetical protein
VLFSRYLLFAAVPLCLLAAGALAWLAKLAAQRLARLGAVSVEPAALRAGLLAGGLVLAQAPVLPFTFSIVVTPARAPLPAVDHFQYLEQWYALYGLGEVADFLRAQARERPTTVVAPPVGSWISLPHDALRLYLRGEPSIRFESVEAIREAESLGDLRPWRSSPRSTFLVTNETHTVELWPFGRPSEGPLLTRKLEAALGRDLPWAERVLMILRPSGLSWLSVYRIDGPGSGGPAGVGVGKCE